MTLLPSQGCLASLEVRPGLLTLQPEQETEFNSEPPHGFVSGLMPWRTQRKREEHSEMLLTQVRSERPYVVNVLIHAGFCEP